jgi:hypothetical protein
LQQTTRFLDAVTHDRIRYAQESGDPVTIAVLDPFYRHMARLMAAHAPTYMLLDDVDALFEEEGHEHVLDLETTSALVLDTLTNAKPPSVVIPAWVIAGCAQLHGGPRQLLDVAVFHKS